ncbi:hypothetical protein Fmac_011364 [Flemingia macrophylla]|uniref:Uncharacterized protein n=1 Tax=Flemingia macrophylla TaxID=520843 RepID=A0ABD1MN10_9FABA
MVHVVPNKENNNESLVKGLKLNTEEWYLIFRIDEISKQQFLAKGLFFASLSYKIVLNIQ